MDQSNQETDPTINLTGDPTPPSTDGSPGPSDGTLPTARSPPTGKTQLATLSPLPTGAGGGPSAQPVHVDLTAGRVHNPHAEHPVPPPIAADELSRIREFSETQCQLLAAYSRQLESLQKQLSEQQRASTMTFQNPVAAQFAREIREMLYEINAALSTLTVADGDADVIESLTITRRFLELRLAGCYIIERGESWTIAHLYVQHLWNEARSPSEKFVSFVWKDVNSKILKEVIDAHKGRSNHGSANTHHNRGGGGGGGGGGSGGGFNKRGRGPRDSFDKPNTHGKKPNNKADA